MKVTYNNIEYICEYGILGNNYVLLKNVQVDDSSFNEIRFEGIQSMSSFDVIEGQWMTPSMIDLERLVKTNTQDIIELDEAFSVLTGVR